MKDRTPPERWPRRKLAPVMGGQAVIEGVMMRSPWRVGLAVRKPDGAIAVEGVPFVSVVRRLPLLDVPIVRGAVSLFEMLSLGMNTLERSARLAAVESKRLSRPAFAATVVVSLAVGVALFVLLPLGAADLLGVRERPIAYNLVAGAIRLVVVLAYLSAISLVPDVKRLFAYHGAEHQSIGAFEAGGLGQPGDAARFSTRHARCGTSFVIAVVLIGILLFALTDTLYAVAFGSAPRVAVRVLYHLALLPVMGGIGYEALKLSARAKDKGVLGLAVLPGLWLQAITTREPDERMREVAFAAMNEALSGWEPVEDA